MKKLNKLNSHPERSEGSFTRFFAFAQNDVIYQQGRSMVEMLGVLAVMGVLSVGGVAMYTNAMNKYKANELLNEASKRAVVVATRALSGQTSIPLTEFSGHSSVAGGTFADEESVDVTGNTFAIKIKGVDSAVCTQMKNSIGSNTVVREIPENCGAEVISLVFNKDLSKSSLPTEPLIDTSIDNQEDCQEAGKTWCYDAIENNSANGVCSNVADCCKTVTLNSCQTCQSVQGQYVVDYKITGASCNFQGINDGQCLPYAPTGSTGCGATNIQSMCLNDMQYAPSETEKSCLPVPCSAVGNCCKAVGEDGLYDVYGQDGLQNLMGQLQEALGEMNLSKGVGLVDQINVAQCTSCDSTDGSLTNASDDTSCYYLEGETLLQNYSNMNDFTDVTLPGKCQNGKCTISDDCDFRDYYGKCHSCNTPEEVDMGCYNCNYMIAQIKKCPNRKLVLYDGDRYAYSVLEYPEAIIPSGDAAWLCSSNAGLNSEFPGLIDVDECINICQSSSTPRKELNGYCVPETCPAGSFRVVQGYDYYNHYGCESCDFTFSGYNMSDGYAVVSKSDCDKCANDGAHARTYDNGICRY